MEKCQLKCSSDYGLSFNSKAKHVTLGGGASRLSYKQEKISDTVNVTWRTSNCGYGYLVAFYYCVLGQVFTIDIIDKTGNVTNRSVRFVPGTFSFSMQNTSSVSVRATLELLNG